MLDGILIPLDGSSGSESVIPYAMLMARQLNQPVTLLNVVGTDEVIAHEEHPAALRLLEMQRDFGYDYLARVRTGFEDAGIQTASDARIGPVPATILEAAAAHGAGLIAMATQGRSGAERARLGSVADRVLRTSPVPVLLVRQPHLRRAHSLDRPVVDEILLPLDGSALSEAAVPVAAYLARAFGASVVVLRAVPFTTDMWSGLSIDAGDQRELAELMSALDETAREYTGQVCDELRAAGVSCTASVVRGAPGLIIAEHTLRHPGSLVVMSTHGRTGLERAVMGSVTESVVRNAVGAVLVVAGVPEALERDRPKGTLAALRA